jgi:hypothetical protein
MRIPLSKIKPGYASKNQYVYKNSGKEYIGDFYQIYGAFYVGKTYDPNVTPDEIIPVKKKAIDNPNSFLYNVLAGAKSGLNVRPVSTKPTKSQALASIEAANKQGFVPVVGVNLDADNESISTNAAETQAASTPREVKRYFYRRIIRTTKEGPEYKIGEITEDEYNFNKDKLKPPVYITAIVTETRIQGDPPYLNTDELNAAEKKIPGLKAFLGIENEQATV